MPGLAGRTTYCTCTVLVILRQGKPPAGEPRAAIHISRSEFLAVLAVVLTHSVISSIFSFNQNVLLLHTRTRTRTELETGTARAVRVLPPGTARVEKKKPLC